MVMNSLFPHFNKGPNNFLFNILLNEKKNAVSFLEKKNFTEVLNMKSISSVKTLSSLPGCTKTGRTGVFALALDNV